MTDFSTGIPNIRVIIREASDQNLTAQIPNIAVNLEPGSQYNVNLVPNTVSPVRTGSFTSYADVAGVALTASYVSGAGIVAAFAESSSYAVTASYADFAGSGGGFPFSGSAVITGSLLMLDTADQGGITGSLYGTASVADGIDVIFAGTFETGSEGVIIPSPSGGLTYINTASYALTASYLNNNIWENISNVPDGLLSSSVQVYNLPVESASYATTASYADVNTRTVTDNHNFSIVFVSQSFLSTDAATHLTFNPNTHLLQISGGVGVSAGVSRISTTGIQFVSGGSHQTLLNKYGVYAESNNLWIGLSADPSELSSSRPSLATKNNPGIYVQSSSAIDTAYIPLEFQGSGSYTDGRVTANRKFVAKEGIEVTGSLTVSGSFVLPTTTPTSPQVGSMYFSGSFIYVYDGTQYRSASLA